MSTGNIIVFSDPTVDTRFVVELAGAFPLKPFDRFCSVFKTNIYRTVISDQRCTLFHTAGFPSSRTDRSSLQAPDILENLYSFTRMFEVHLLIYVVRTDTPISSNFRFFYDYKMLLSSLFRPHTHLQSFRGLRSSSLWMAQIQKVIRLNYTKP
jgi:hypothetical protein